MSNYLALVVVAVVIVAGCGKKENAEQAAPQSSLMKPGDSLPPVTPTPPLPAPDVPPGPKVQLPQVGQAGDHSSPGFKGGGKPDTK